MHAAAPGLRRLAIAMLVVLGGCTNNEPLVAFLGDSLTDGWGLSRKEAYPALVERQLAAQGTAIVVLNAGRGGDTVSQGQARLASVLRKRPDVLVVALGVNDALRGMRVEEAECGLRNILREAKAGGVTVVLVGVSVPPSMATAQSRQYEAVYRELAQESAMPFVPDLLEGVSGQPALMFPDGLHPNARGQERLAVNVVPAIKRALDEHRARPRGR